MIHQRRRLIKMSAWTESLSAGLREDMVVENVKIRAGSALNLPSHTEGLMGNVCGDSNISNTTVVR